MEAPSWRHRGTNGRYQKSVVAVVVAPVSKAMVDRCVAAVTVIEKVDNTAEGEGTAGKFRQ